MQISNIKSQNINKNNITFKGAGRELIRDLANPDSLKSVIALESSVTGGRGINAYKRGGKYEFRERFTDDVVSAVFWMKGVDIFNKLGNKFGEKVLKLPTTNFDAGSDALRTPFDNLVAKEAKGDMVLAKKLAVFKFTKIILSTLLATGFVGFALPKINQAITEKLMKKRENGTKTPEFDIFESSSFENFDKKLNSGKIPSEIQSFKGLQTLTTVANALENNKICKMLTCDTGILTGRVATARNADEGREYFFRDITSCFFYFASTPLIYKLLQTLTKSRDLTDIDPVSAESIIKMMKKELQNADGSYNAVKVKEFAPKTMGVLDNEAEKLISKLPFNSDVISVNELKKHINDAKVTEKAEKLACLQPAQAKAGRVLTKQQVIDSFKNGAINDSDFMQTLYKNKFGSDLTDPYKYIPMKKITKFRDDIDRFAQKVIDTAAKKNNGIIDTKFLDKINRKSFMMSAVFRVIALGISAAALGIAIPKLQYAMTAKRTGENSAPGLRKFEEEQKNTAVKT